MNRFVNRIGMFALVGIASLLGACAGTPKDPGTVAASTRAQPGQDANLLSQGASWVGRQFETDPVENLISLHNSKPGQEQKLQKPGEKLEKRLLTEQASLLVKGDQMKSFLAATPGTPGYGEARTGIDGINRKALGWETSAVTPLVDDLAGRLRAVAGDLATAESSRDLEAVKSAKAALANIAPLHHLFATYQGAIAKLTADSGLVTFSGLTPQKVIEAAGPVEVASPIDPALYAQALGTGDNTKVASANGTPAPREIAPGRFDRPANGK